MTTQWVRNAVMLTVTAVWAVVVLTSLWRGAQLEPYVWGVPGGLWFVMNPVMPRRTPPPVAEDNPGQ